MKTKRILYAIGIVLAIVVITSINDTETKALEANVYGRDKFI